MTILADFRPRADFHSDGRIEWQGATFRTLLDPAFSGGAMSIVESVAPPRFGPPRHIHAAEDEAFVILSGQALFWLEGETVLKGAGETVFIPRGAEHTFMVVGDRPMRHLLILTPGGFEGFFAEMAESRARIPEDMAGVAEAAKRFHTVFTGPPLSAVSGVAPLPEGR